MKTFGLGFFVIALTNIPVAWAMGEKPPERPKPWEVSRQCPKGSVVRVKMDGRVFELPRSNNDPFVKILDAKGQEKTLFPYQYGCYRYQLEEQPIEAVNVQYQTADAFSDLLKTESVRVGQFQG